MPLCSLANTYHNIDFASKSRSRLFRGESEGLAAFLNHFAHFADAFRALRGAVISHEDVAGTRRARLDGGGDVTLA